MVRRRLCDLHFVVVGNCFCHFVVRTSSNRSIASGAWPTVLYTQLRRRFWHFARPTIFDSQLLDQNRDLCIYPTCIRRPGSGSRRNITTPFGVEKLEWCGYPTVKKNWRYVYSFWQNLRTWPTDRQTDRHRMTAQPALAKHRASIKRGIRIY